LALYQPVRLLLSRLPQLLLIISFWRVEAREATLQLTTCQAAAVQVDLEQVQV
jgi:hypothetical protein